MKTKRTPRRKKNEIAPGVKGDFITITNGDMSKKVLIPRKDHTMEEIYAIIKYTPFGVALLERYGTLEDVIAHLAGLHLRTNALNYEYIRRRSESRSLIYKKLKSAKGKKLFQKILAMLPPDLTKGEA